MVSGAGLVDWSGKRPKLSVTLFTTRFCCQNMQVVKNDHTDRQTTCVTMVVEWCWHGIIELESLTISA
jgi:hypothetical protein